MGGMLAGIEAYRQLSLLGFYGGYLYNYIGTDANESNKVNGGTPAAIYVARQDNQHYDSSLGRLRIRRLRESPPHLVRRPHGRRRDRRLERLRYLERGITFGDRRLAIQPFGGLQYIYFRQNDFTETGAAAANLAVPGIDTHSFRSVLGTRVFGQSFSPVAVRSRRNFGRYGCTSFSIPRTDFTTVRSASSAGQLRHQRPRPRPRLGPCSAPV